MAYQRISLIVDLSKDQIKAGLDEEVRRNIMEMKSLHGALAKSKYTKR